jgi:hypothetical protein
MQIKRLLQPLTSPLAVLIYALAGGELLLRAVGFEYPPAADRGFVWSKEEDRAMRAGTSFNQFDPITLWNPRPGALIAWTKDERVNSAGYRGPLVPKERRPGVMRILTLGSCAAFGRGIAYEDTYSALLVQHLRERGIEAEVLSGGVVGSTIQQGLERYRNVFREYRPDLVISSFCGYKEHDSASRYECDGARMKSWRADPDRSPCRAHRWSPRRNLRIVQLPIWMFHVLDGTYWKEVSLDFEEGRLHPLVKDCDAPVVRRVSPEEFMEALETLDREMCADGGRLMLANVPNNVSQARQSSVVEMYGEQLREFGQRRHVVHVNGRDVIRRAAQQGTPASELFDPEGFPSACAHDLLAQALADEIASQLEHTR